MTIIGDFDPVAPPGPERKVLSGPAERNTMAGRGYLAQFSRLTMSGPWPLNVDVTWWTL
jgi:hypothetical protein